MKIENIKEKDIKHLITEITGLQFSKNNLKECPVCGGRGFSVKNNLFKCFSCNNKGDIIEFICNYKDIDFKSAIKELSSDSITPSAPTYENIQIDRKVDIEVNNEFIRYISANLSEYEAKPIRKYMLTRGFNIDKLNDVYILTNYNRVNQHLKDKFGTERMVKSGLFSEKGNLIFYKHRIIFAHNWLNNTRYIHARLHTEEKETSKYLYQSGCKIPFSLSAFLSPIDKVYITEGVTDCLSLTIGGYSAISIGSVNAGEKVLSGLVKMAKKYNKKLIFLFDNDIAVLRALESNEYKNIAKSMQESNVSYLYQMTIEKDVNEAYNLAIADRKESFNIRTLSGCVIGLNGELTTIKPSLNAIKLNRVIQGKINMC